MQAFGNYLVALWQILLELAPSLLLGLFIAGLVHSFLPPGLIRRSLSGANFSSVAKASVVGVPMTLCSCGVIPTALGLRKEGASPGATTAFMVSTPQVGADSVLVSAAFLGWPFAIFKILAALVTGLISGTLVNRLVPAESAPNSEPNTQSNTASNAAMTADTDDRAAASDRSGHRRRSLVGALRYSVFDLLAAIDLWLIAGVLASALITTLTPADFFSGQVWAQGLLGMLVVLMISLPLYVCTTASVPLAAALIAAGMPAGSALVFLMAGPATNVATIGAVYRTLGGPVLSIYLGTVIVMSLGLAMLFDGLLSVPTAGVMSADAHAHGTDWLGFVSALVLLGLLGMLLFRRIQARFFSAPNAQGDLVLEVTGMSCQHCVGSVKGALEALDGVSLAEPQLGSGIVSVKGQRLDIATLRAAVEQAGFGVAGVSAPNPDSDPVDPPKGMQ